MKINFVNEYYEEEPKPPYQLDQLVTVEGYQGIYIIESYIIGKTISKDGEMYELVYGLFPYRREIDDEDWIEAFVRDISPVTEGAAHLLSLPYRLNGDEVYGVDVSDERWTGNSERREVTVKLDADGLLDRINDVNYMKNEGLYTDHEAKKRIAELVVEYTSFSKEG